MADSSRLSDTWPRLADGLFDFLADIEMPDETLADLDVAIRACRLLAEAEAGWFCRIHQQFDWNDEHCWAFEMGMRPCLMYPARLVVESAIHPTTEEE